METLKKVFSTMILFVYHCFDRLVINGYLSMLSRPGNIVYFFQEVVGEPCITEEVLSARTKDYQNWVEKYARNHNIPIQWAEKDVRKEDFVRPWLSAMERRNEFGVYLILKSMEQGPTFRSAKPKYETPDPNYRILKTSRSRFTHYYFYIRDERLGPMIIRVGSFLPFQATYWLNGHNFIERELLRAGIAFRKDDNAFIATGDPDALQVAADRLSPEIIQERLDYWTLIVGPKFSKHEREAMNLRRFYAFSQTEYCANFIFRNNFPIRRLFQRSCELSLFSLSADKVTNIFGWRVNRRFKGKLQAVLERLNQGHYVLRAHFKNSFLKAYEKLRTFLRLEVCSNNLANLRLKKSLSNLPLLREASRTILDRFANMQSQTLNIHFDFPLLQKLALPTTCVNTRLAGIKIQDTRILRLMETLMHLGSCLAGYPAALIHKTIVDTYHLPDYTITQLRYDLRKMKAHGLVERHGKHYAYHLTDKGLKVATMFVLFHKRLCGPLANSLFVHRPEKHSVIKSKLEKAYHQADASIKKIIDLLAA